MTPEKPVGIRIMTIKTFISLGYKKQSILFTLLILVLSPLAGYAQQELNPTFFYYINGKTVGGWSLQVSDESDWGGVKATDSIAVSAGGKVEISSANYVGEGDAVRVTWDRRKKRGQFSVYGPHIDLSSVKDVAAITFDIKVERAPNKSVDIAMDCGWPCRAQFNIAKNLRKAPRNQWFIMPIPLNCFTGDNFDLSKINGPLLLSTEGRMEILIANIRVEALPEGDPGCANNEG